MAIIGIIAEFNPFHLGHKHIIDSAKRDGDTVICVMSGNYVQRGDTAIIPKAARAKMAIDCGADLIAELPTPYCLSSAQNFAFGAVSILNSLEAEKLLFGSECGDIEKLKRTAEVLQSEGFKADLKQRLSSGKTYAKIISELLNEKYPELCGILDNPNDALAVEYIYAIKRIGAKIESICIKRIGAAHDSKDISVTASASLIRDKIKCGDLCFIEKLMPKQAFEVLKSSPISDIKRLEGAILARLRERALFEDFSMLPDISEGLENRLIKAIKESSTLDELYENIKTKRYTLARVRRLVLSAYLGIDSRFTGAPPAYIRILGFNRNGQRSLSEIVKKCDIPIITNTADIKALQTDAKAAFKNENLFTDIYSLSLSEPQKTGIEYYQKIYKGEIQNV